MLLWCHREQKQNQIVPKNVHGFLTPHYPRRISFADLFKIRTSPYNKFIRSYLEGSFPLRGENVGVVSRLFAVDALYQKEFPEMES